MSVPKGSFKLVPGHNMIINGKRVYSPEFQSYRGMILRCYQSKNANAKYYSEKGIQVDDRWHIFENFLEDMKNRPDGTSLDRIDSNKGYSKDNCRWSTAKQQAINRDTKRGCTGHKGISYHKGKGKFYVYKNIDNKQINIGHYSTLKEAIEAQKINIDMDLAISIRDIILEQFPSLTIILGGNDELLQTTETKNDNTTTQG